MIKKIISLFKKEPPQIAKKPLVPVPRFPCPFYGFHKTFGDFFMDQSGNQCPLMEHTCQMEYSPSGPDWNRCPFNCKKNAETINHILDTYEIVPDEFWPEGQSSWSGMSFKVWMEYVMSSDTPRPITSKKSETPAEAGCNQ